MTSPPAAATPHTTSGWLPLGAIAVTLVLWASAFVAIRHVAQDFSPGALTLGRLVPGTIVLLGMLVIRRRWVAPTGREWGILTVIGVLWFGVYNVALNAGEQRLDAGTAALLMQLSPILIAVLAAIFLAERFTWPLTVGLSLAFGGVAVISLADTPAGSPDPLGVLMCLVAAVAYAISLILQKPVVSRLPALQVTAIACTVAMVCTLPFGQGLLDDLAAAPDGAGWWLVYLGVFPTAIAFTTYAFALNHMDATKLGVTTYLIPPITIALGALFLDEVPPALAYLGGGLALVGVAVARRSR